METIRVLPRGKCLVLDLEYVEQTRQRKYVGRRAIAALKLEELPADAPRHEAHNDFLPPGERPMPHYAFPSTGDVVTLPFRREYRDEVTGGCLWPADEATAKLCGVPFDPNFGGEYPALSKPAKGGKAAD